MSESTPARPQPVLRAAQAAAAVSGLVGAIGAVLTLIGWATADQVQSWVVVAGGIVTALATFISVAAPILAALRARELVTPLSDPQFTDDIGQHALEREV